MVINKPIRSRRSNQAKSAIWKNRLILSTVPITIAVFQFK